MYDNKVRLSQDVLEKATEIAAEWGLKNARAAVEAVFRKYADEYLQGRQLPPNDPWNRPAPTNIPQSLMAIADPYACEALTELDDLLGL